MMQRCFSLLVICLLWASLTQAHELEISKASVRLAPAVADSTAAYALIRNDGEHAIRIIGISCPEAIAGKAMLHDMRMNNGRMQMNEIASVAIPAGGELSFQPGGKHIMLVQLKRPLKAGEKIPLSLIFDDGSLMDFDAKVVDMRQQSMPHHPMH